MIKHIVTFALKHAPNSPQEEDFLAASRELFAIPGVLNFKVRRQTSHKNPHSFGISMNFASKAEYEAYVEHPAHQSFITDRWLKEVSDFKESDFEELV